MMKKLMMLMMALCCIIPASAESGTTPGNDFKGTMKVKLTNNLVTPVTITNQERQDVVVTINRNFSDGTYNAYVNDLILVINNKEVNLGPLEYTHMKGTKDSNGYTVISGSQNIAVRDIQGYTYLVPDQYQYYLDYIGDDTYPVHFQGRFNDKTLSAKIDTNISIWAYYNLVHVFDHTVQVDFSGNKVAAPLLGDLDGDGQVDVNDVSLLIDYVLGKETNILPGVQIDIDSDGHIDVTDVSYLIDIVLGKI